MAAPVARVADVVVLVGVVAAGAVGTAAVAAGSKAPSKCHLPVKLLNGPPTMVLAHSMVNFFVAGS